MVRPQVACLASTMEHVPSQQRQRQGRHEFVLMCASLVQYNTPYSLWIKRKSELNSHICSLCVRLLHVHKMGFLVSLGLFPTLSSHMKAHRNDRGASPGVDKMKHYHRNCVDDRLKRNERTRSHKERNRGDNGAKQQALPAKKGGVKGDKQSLEQ